MTLLKEQRSRLIHFLLIVMDRQNVLRFYMWFYGVLHTLLLQAQPLVTKTCFVRILFQSFWRSCVCLLLYSTSRCPRTLLLSPDPPAHLFHTSPLSLFNSQIVSRLSVTSFVSFILWTCFPSSYQYFDCTLTSKLGPHHCPCVSLPVLQPSAVTVY